MKLPNIFLIICAILSVSSILLVNGKIRYNKRGGHRTVLTLPGLHRTGESTGLREKRTPTVIRILETTKPILRRDNETNGLREKRGPIRTVLTQPGLHRTGDATGLREKRTPTVTRVVETTKPVLRRDDETS